MSSRQKEKERRRLERLERERAEAAKAARSKRLQIVGGAVLAVAAVVAVGFAVFASGGGSDADSPQAATGTPSVPIPAKRISDLNEAAAAARCKLVNPPNEGNNHVTSKVTYKSNPAASGDHNPDPASDGSYVGVSEPPIERLVHSLEHGRIQIQYAPTLPRKQVDQLETLFNEASDQYAAGQYMQIFENKTDMPYEVAAVAWNHVLACPAMNDRVFDAIRAFREKWTLQAPEKIIQPE